MIETCVKHPCQSMTCTRRWPELATAKTEWSHRHCLRHRHHQCHPIYIQNWKGGSSLTQSVTVWNWKRYLWLAGRWQVAAVPLPSHRLPWPGFCLSNAPFKWSPFASFAWLNISTIYNPTPPRWWLELQCATSRHYLVNCSCTVGFVKMDNLDLIRARNM